MELCYTKDMANKYRLQVKGSTLLEKSGEPNANQFSHRARLSIQTAYRYIQQPEEVLAFDSRVLARILIDGLGLTPEKALDLKFGDVFDLVEVD